MSVLDQSVTLEDVFVVVEAKRVPLAPELAGYLSLEIADGTDAGSGDVDPKTVFISEEGTVALVRPKKDVVTGEAESSIRALLAKLLDASGSSTPALTLAARRKPGNGLPALVEELEAALIPVNRAAGRRALARLAREVKRVMLGVGRNASSPPMLSSPPKREEPPPAPAPAPAPTAAPAPALPGVPKDVELRPSRVFDDEAATVPRRANPLAEPPAPAPAPALPAPPAAAPRGASPLPPPPGRPASGPPAPPPPPARNNDRLFGGDEVESLLDTFEVSNLHGDKQMSRELKAIAGLSPTPPPPDAKSIDALVKDIGKDLPKMGTEAEPDGVEALLALADASGPLAPPLPPPGFPAKPDIVEVAPPAEPPAVAPPPAALAAPPLPAPAPPAAPVAAPPPPVPAPAPAASAPAIPAAAPSRGASPSSRREPVSEAPGEQPSPSRRKRRATGGSGKHRQPRAPKTSLAILVFVLFLLVGAVAFVWIKAPRLFTGKKKPLASASASVSAAPAVPAPPKCKVALVVSDVPANAEILLRMGQAPLDVERMPVGTRLEFVGTAEGYAPKRAVIKAESTWDKGPDGKPRIDVPIQLDPSKAKPGAIDPWPGAEPGSQVGGSGAPGTVHVVSNVRGAEIWLLAGLGPEARIEQLRCDADIDVLLAGPPTLRKRLHVAEKEIGDAPADPQGNKVISVSAK